MLKSLLSASMRKGLQKSIELELYQANLWKSFANQMQRLGYFGTQKYFLAESAEELTHYQMLVEFMNDMGDCADLPKIDAVSDKVNNIGEALELGYEMEMEVLNHYKKFYQEADEEDCAVGIFLQQFVTIQVQAVGHYGDLLAKYKIAEATKELLEFDEHIADV